MSIYKVTCRLVVLAERLRYAAWCREQGTTPRAEGRRGQPATCANEQPSRSEQLDAPSRSERLTPSKRSERRGCATARS